MFEGYGFGRAGRKRRKSRRKGGKRAQRARFTRAAKACKGQGQGRRAFQACMRRHLKK